MHERWKYYGRRQGAECDCGAAFYPASGARVDILAAFRHHVFTTTGLWPEERQP